MARPYQTARPILTNKKSMSMVVLTCHSSYIESIKEGLWKKKRRRIVFRLAWL
jgi:hypothetical protein